MIYRGFSSEAKMEKMLGGACKYLVGHSGGVQQTQLPLPPKLKQTVANAVGNDHERKREYHWGALQNCHCIQQRALLLVLLATWLTAHMLNTQLETS